MENVNDVHLTQSNLNDTEIDLKNKEIAHLRAEIKNISEILQQNILRQNTLINVINDYQAFIQMAAVNGKVTSKE